MLTRWAGSLTKHLVSREMVNLEPTVPPELEKGWPKVLRSPSGFPSSRTANAC